MAGQTNLSTCPGMATLHSFIPRNDYIHLSNKMITCMPAYPVVGACPGDYGNSHFILYPLLNEMLWHSMMDKKCK